MWTPLSSVPLSKSQGGPKAQKFITIPLRKNFCYLHEPLEAATSALLEQSVYKQEAHEFARRIHNSRGGAFLLTGYRGVGKTSFVNQVLEELRATCGEGDEAQQLIPLRLNLPRACTPEVLMYSIIRQLRGALTSNGILDLLPVDIRRQLDLAYQRTASNLKRNSTSVNETVIGKQLGLEFAALPSAKTSIPLPFEWKQGRTEVEESTFLPYTDHLAEQDIISLVRFLNAGFDAQITGPRRGILRRKSVTTRRIALRIVMVFDELDKIETPSAETRQTKPSTPAAAGESESAVALPAAASQAKADIGAIELLLSSLKGLLTMSTMTFLFVAGREIFDRLIADKLQGDSVYESVFAADRYLPCKWDLAKDIAESFVEMECFSRKECPACMDLRGLTPNGLPFCGECRRYLDTDLDEAKLALKSYVQFLSYVGRGLPRRTLRAFNDSVRVIQGVHVLAFSEEEIRHFRANATLWEALSSGIEKIVGFKEASSLPYYDQRMLAVLYVVDCMLLFGEETFVVPEILECARRISYKIIADDSVVPRFLPELIWQLLQMRLLEEVITAASQQTGTPKRYKWAPRFVRDMNLGGGSRKGASSHLHGMGEVRSLKFGDYLAEELIGEGGFAKVYRGTDLVSGSPVAIKVPRPASPGDNMEGRFAREVHVLRTLNHRNIVKHIHSSTQGGEMYMVMEFVPGVSLSQLIAQRDHLSVTEAHEVATQYCSALQHAYSCGFERFDVKPHNVLVTSTGRVVMIDFGTARPTKPEQGAHLTREGVVIGTPGYAAPEAMSLGAFSERCDVFSFGVVLYEMLSGKKPFPFDNGAYQLEASIEPLELPNHELSAKLKRVTMKCLGKNPEHRYSTFSEILSDLTGATREFSKLPSQSSPTSPKGDLAKAVQVGQKAIAARSELSNETTVDFQYPIDPRKSPRIPAQTAGPGAFTYFFQAQGNPPPKSARKRGVVFGEFTEMFGPVGIYPWLERLDSAGQPSEIRKITRPKFTLGRSQVNSWVLAAPEVSRLHAEIVVEADQSYIENIGSQAVLVNGLATVGQEPLSDQDRIQIGTFHFRYHLKQPPPKPPRPPRPRMTL